MNIWRPGVTRILAAVLLAFGLLSCGGCRRGAERAVYRVACETVRNAPDVPDSIVIHPRRNTFIALGKNAARVDLDYDYVDEAGRKVTRTYTVWCKRIEMRWEPDRAFPTPRYQAANPVRIVPADSPAP